MLWEVVSLKSGTKLSPFFEEIFHVRFLGEPMIPEFHLKAG